MQTISNNPAMECVVTSCPAHLGCHRLGATAKVFDGLGGGVEQAAHCSQQLAHALHILGLGLLHLLDDEVGQHRVRRSP